ncbi:hypothetical protein Lfu02_14750 [Longispora fulva]|uniref:DNA-binding transcriptional ArsR family regulator n=1 Tax=Longispora fulva TaxID=619741 RepID=A0A8J7GMI6_9ACTN|nr:helix-turn-helix domain-containing protein [Longispora fulva]MBG6140515.1 DNA-binding transcriptional ArsR family regulator [Longispora fulva]GIG57103.1 hypothetical protein Lfu02_14750 [Longispora fulva]
MTHQRLKAALRGSELPAVARHLMLTLLTYCEDDTLVLAAADSPSVTELAEDTGLNRSTVRRHLAALDDDGWLTRQHPDRRAARARGLVIAYVLQVPEGTDVPGFDSAGAGEDVPEPPAERGTEHRWGRTMRHERGPVHPVHGAQDANHGAQSTVQGAQNATRGAQRAPVLRERENLSLIPSQPTTAVGLIARALDVAEDEASRVLQLIREECRPRSELGFVRTIIANGDVASFGHRIREASAAAAYEGPTHQFRDPDGTGHCADCALPATSPRHRSPAPAALRLVR